MPDETPESSPMPDHPPDAFDEALEDYVQERIEAEQSAMLGDVSDATIDRHVAAIDTTRAKLRRLYDAARQDADRLDWLEAQRSVIVRLASDRLIVKDIDMQPGMTTVAIHCDEQSFYGPDTRAAIDAAREARDA